MNKQQMMDLVLSLMGEQGEGTFTYPQIEAVIDAAQDSVVTDFMAPKTHLFMDSKPITTEAGEYLYDMPEGMIDSHAGALVRGADNTIVLFDINTEPFDPTATSPRAAQWRLFGNKIWLYPTPNETTTYSILARYYPEYLSLDPIEEGGELTQSTLPRQLQTIICYTAAEDLAGSVNDAYGNYGFISRRLSKMIDDYRAIILTAQKPSKVFYNSRFRTNGGR